MARITIDVKDSKVAFVLELLNSLNYVKVEKQEAEDFVVPEWHKKIVLERMKNAKKEDYIEWSALDKKLKKEFGI